MTILRLVEGINGWMCKNPTFLTVLKFDNPINVMLNSVFLMVFPRRTEIGWL